MCKPATLTCFTLTIKFSNNINKLTDHSIGALPMHLHCTDSFHNTYLTFTELCSSAKIYQVLKPFPSHHKKVLNLE